MPAPNDPPPPNEDRHAITCLYCHQQQEVSPRAISISCRFCYKRLVLEALSIIHYEAHRLVATCGLLTVEKKGTVVTDLILCGRLVVRGKVKAKIKSQGLVLISQEGQVKGDVTAPTLAVSAGAVLEGQYAIGPKTP